MKRRLFIAALALSLLVPGVGRADEPVQLEAASPKRAVPDYDGRGPPPEPPGDELLWVPRVVLAPAYLVTEFVVRRPLSVIVPAAERIDLPRKTYDFFTFGPDHKAGVVPVGFVEFGFLPSVGVYAFWDDAGFTGDDLRLHAEVWPDDWLAGSLAERIRIDDARSLSFKVSGLRRPDMVFYGLGPNSLQSDQSRYGLQRFEGSASYQWRYWRSSTLQTTVGVRDVKTYDGYYGTDPSLSAEAATGAFPVPYGFDSEYTAEYNRLLASLDTRRRATRSGSGIRVELDAEQGSDVRNTPASGWVRWGGTVGGYVDLNGYGRVLGLTVTTVFADPLGSQPIPFTELPYLGGDHPMAGFYQGRLTGRSTGVTTLGYEWPIGPWLNGDLQLSVGNAFGEHLEGFDAKLLRVAGALGISVAGLQDAPLQFLLGIGSDTFERGASIDSVRVMVGVPHSF